MTTAFSYVRFSSKPQEQGDSLRRQVEESRKFAQEQGWTLDESLRDLGVSAWKGKNKSTGALGGFLKQIEAGRVPKGSWLLVEAMDRLSREQVSDALTLFLRIIQAGVGIVTIQDRKRYTLKSINESPHELMYSIMLMAAAHEYSSKLSYRVRQARDKALDDLKAGKRITVHGKPPMWLQWDAENEAYKVHPDRHRIVRQMIEWALSGIGCTGIAKRLAKAGYATREGHKTWSASVVRRMLRSPALYGIYTPERRRDGKHMALDPVANYYPPIATEEEFYRLQASLDARRNTIRGRTGQGVLMNVFGNQLLRFGDDGAPSVIVSRSNQQGKVFTNIASSAAKYGSSDKQLSFPYEIFVRAFLLFVREVKLNAQPADGGNVDALRGRRGEKAARLAKISALIESGDLAQLSTLAAAASKLEAEIKDLDRQIEAERAKLHKPAATTGDIEDLGEQLEGMPDGPEKAERKQALKLAIADVVKSIRLHVQGVSVRRACIAIVEFRDGSARTFGVRVERYEQPVVALFSEFSDVSVEDRLGNLLARDYSEASLAFALDTSGRWTHVRTLPQGPLASGLPKSGWKVA
jgi:DNA invertase Pin-like site-specific DNA recombinase